MSERLFKLDAARSPLPLSGLGRAFRSCPDCRNALHVLVCPDSTLEVSCGTCKARWRTFRSGGIIRRSARSAEPLVFLVAFAADPVSGSTVVEAPLFEEVLDLEAAWAAR